MGKITKEEYIDKVNELEPKFAEIFNKVGTAYAILQRPVWASPRFLNFTEFVEDFGRLPARDDYKLMWAARLNANEAEEYTTVTDIAETIFAKFNGPNRPGLDDDYYGTSVSVSDIIVVKTNGTTFAYYVDFIGFKRLANFNV